MSIELHTRLKQLQEDGAELIEYSQGHIVSPEHPCKIVYANRIRLRRDGRLETERPCTTVTISAISAEGVENGTKEEILKAIEEGRLPGDDEMMQAVQNARFLFLHEAEKILVITKSEGNTILQVDKPVFYFRETQREEAVSMATSYIKESNNKLFSKRNIQEKDLMTIAIFVAMQLQ
jgi:hypothetical protein